MNNDALKTKWARHLLGQGIGYPSEGVVRIFKGRFPRLALDPSRYRSMRVCDVGFGDGRNLVLLQECGFDVYGIDISQEVVEHVSSGLERRGIQARLKVGENKSIPFEDGFFDCLLAWHTSYYVNAAGDFPRHVAEFARVLKPGGLLVAAIPMRTNYIYQDIRPLENGYCQVNSTPHHVQDGQILRVFSDQNEIRKEFEPFFKDFVFARAESDFFGLAWNDHMFICERKGLRHA